MDNRILFTSHSKISNFPPNPNEFPNFYHCKEHIYVLKPGDSLYIPPGWFHWVFSYPDEKYNLAISFNILNPECKNIYNEFTLKKPFLFNLDKKNHTFLNTTLSDIKKVITNYKNKVLFSRYNTIIPVKKENNKNIYSKNINFDNILKLYSTDKYNLSISQDSILPKLLNVTLPTFIQNSFPSDDISCYTWLNLLKNDCDYIETGLHYDITHNILIQIHGSKIIRLYEPKCSKNLYIQPFYSL